MAKCKTCGGTFKNRLGECNLCGLLGAGKVPSGHTPGCWPMTSLALSCTPQQVRAMNERNARHGIAARYEADGTCVIPSRGDRKKLIRLESGVLGRPLHDLKGGYGD